MNQPKSNNSTIKPKPEVVTGDDRLVKEKSSQSYPANSKAKTKSKKSKNQPKEYGGRKDGLDPTRYGDWEKNGRCIDF